MNAPPVREHRPGAATSAVVNARLVVRLAGHETVSFFRTPVAAFFTMGLPLIMMVIVGAVAGNAVIEARAGVRVMQFVVPVLAVFGVAQACFGVLALRLTELRERGCLKRMRGTPVPAWVLMSGLAGGAAAISLMIVVLLLGAGVSLYEVRPVWHRSPALVLTLLVGAGCFTALGFALVTVVRSTAVVQILANGLLMALGFVSDVFVQGEGVFPRWLEIAGWVLPLKHFANAVGDGLNPLLPGDGPPVDHLAVLAAWGTGGAVVAVWRFAWDRGPARPAAARAGGRTRTRPQGRPRGWRLLTDQIAHANTGLRRDPSSAFFTAVLPVLLLALFSAIFGDTRIEGLSLPRFMVAAMTTYALGVACYVNLAGFAARDRERGVLKRLAGTPLPGWAYHAGRVASALWVTLATAAALTLLGVVVYDVEPRAGMILPALVAIVLGTACFAVLGALVARVARRESTANAVTLGTFLPLAFVSGVFPVGGRLPATLETAGDMFPLKHLAHALTAAVAPVARPWPWADLGVVVAWTLAGTVALVLLRNGEAAVPVSARGPTRPAAAGGHGDDHDSGRRGAASAGGVGRRRRRC
ncbi:ABC transporter permease [Sphaerisporangium sp. TRM90804]|uniref:ABC transporter permease n=1 Tax=Sphaerisporangium sp. TRM90804 TaxID=3031113 RepID=UPI00244B422F|nr:ABC transporter permease [Sphaerisporangium sp. TRM90804]MDH2426214.1 ABC transporter permease [Sphaerisporangium sp. TRM90804]